MFCFRFGSGLRAVGAILRAKQPRGITTFVCTAFDMLVGESSVKRVDDLRTVYIETIMFTVGGWRKVSLICVVNYCA